MSAPERRVVAGIQPVRELIRARAPAVERVMVERGRSPRLDAVARFAEDSSAPRVDRVSRRELDVICSAETHQGVVAFAPPLAFTTLDELLADESLLAVALDGVTDPQNFGAVIRSAVALAGAAVIWGEHASAPLSTATFRASAGAVEHARLCRVTSLQQALTEAKDRGVAAVGLDRAAETALAGIDLRGPTILVIGSEQAGLGRAVRRMVKLASLGARGAIDSLNASAAAAVATYEVTRQRADSVRRILTLEASEASSGPEGRRPSRN